MALVLLDLTVLSYIVRTHTHTHTHPHIERQRNSRTDRALNSSPTSRLPTASEMTS